jgi:hypothetical protein
VVLASAAYHAAVGRSPDYGIVTFLTPPGYKWDALALFLTDPRLPS